MTARYKKPGCKYAGAVVAQTAFMVSALVFSSVLVPVLLQPVLISCFFSHSLQGLTQILQ
jgi:hypothetical protein